MTWTAVKAASIGLSADKPSVPIAADKTVVIACSSWFDTSSSTIVTAAKPLLVTLVVIVPADLPASEEEEEDKLGDLVLTVVVADVRTFS